MSGFRKALLWTAIPIVVLSIIGMIGMTDGFKSGLFLLAFAWWGGALYFIAGMIALTISVLAHNKQIMAGILVGLAIGIVSLGVTCFAGNTISGGWWF